MKIGIMEAGGLGGYIGGRLAQGGHDVAFIARGAHLKAMLDRGLRVQSPLGDFTIKPANATDDPGEVGEVDLILFSVKTYDALEAIEMMRPMVGAQTVILPVLNGVTHIELLGDQLGYDHVLGGMSMVAAHIAEPGLIQHYSPITFLEFGEIGGGISERCKSIQNALTQRDIIDIKAVPNVLERMWWKFTGFSGAGLWAIVRGDKGLIWDFPELRELNRDVISEVVAVAGAKGISLPPSTVDEWMEVAGSAPPQAKPSMVVDLESGKRLELEALNGALSRYGKELGVPTPVNDFIYACLKPYANGQPEQ